MTSDLDPFLTVKFYWLALKCLLITLPIDTILELDLTQRKILLQEPLTSAQKKKKKVFSFSVMVLSCLRTIFCFESTVTSLNSPVSWFTKQSI